MRLLVARGSRVLITSYTHAAVDNLLIKLLDSGVGRRKTMNPLNTTLVRIGQKPVCKVELHDYLVQNVASALDSDCIRDDNDSHHQQLIVDRTGPSIRSLSHVISSAKIVGVSALTIPKSPLLRGERFDYVICDEAGQINQPAILGALMTANSFILVGDHEQLPPLTRSLSAERAGK